MRLEKNELRVGIFILVPIAILLLFILFKLGYSLVSSTIDIYMKVDNIASIKVGTQVKVKGYSIGRVVEIEPEYKPNLHFLILLRIKRDFQLYENCSATILNQNIIGDTVIEIKNPDSKENELKEGSIIEGVEFVNLDVIVTDVHVLLTSITKTVNKLNSIAGENSEELNVLITNLSKSSKKLDGILENSQSDITDAISKIRSASETLDEIAKEIKKSPLGFIF